MTITDIQKFELMDRALTLPDLPDEYLEVVLLSDDQKLEEIKESSYPLAVSDVSEECILDFRKLTDEKNVKEVYSVQLSTSFHSFNPGDTIGIVPKNKEEDIQQLFNHLGINHLSTKKCKICEKKSLKKNQSTPSFINKITTLKHVFTHCLDIHCIPKKSFIRVLSEFTRDLEQKRYLQELCCKEKSELYTKNVLESNKTFLNFLLMFPSCYPPVARLIENLPKLMPRPYSIASSPLAYSNKVKIVFSVVKTEKREGLCTGMLKQIINNKNGKKSVKMFFRKCNGFTLPKENVPLILIGPGTGLSPFMGFLEHRKLQKIVGIIWLFYGCHSKADYLFKEELQEYLDLGVLTKLCVAFSRDCNTEAKYVQDNIKKYGKEITKLVFEGNALIYVCGDAKNMRKDVQNSFIEVFENHKGMSNKEATECIKKLQKDKRYLQDIWL